MDIWKAAGCFLLVIMFVGVGHGQDEARIETTQASVVAGDRLQMKVTLAGTPPPCDARVEVYFQDPKTGEQFYLFAPSTPGRNEVTVAGFVPKDIGFGEYKSTVGTISPCPGYSKTRQLKVSETVVTVTAFPNPIQLPSSAEVKLTLTQKQFLQMKMTQLSALKGQLDTVVEQNSSNPSVLQSILLGIVNQAEDELTDTEKQYQERMLISQGKLPAFFADFHVQYQALRAHLKTVIPPIGQARNASSAKLVYVQLRERTPAEDVAPTGSPDVDKLRHLIKDNSKAYSIVKETGRAVFHARLSSYPMGARVSYKNALDDQYMDYSSPTNVSYATFDLAYWDFKFHKEGCADDQSRRINPYEESDPADISVEFNRCKSQ